MWLKLFLNVCDKSTWNIWKNLVFLLQEFFLLNFSKCYLSLFTFGSAGKFIWFYYLLLFYVRLPRAKVPEDHFQSIKFTYLSTSLITSLFFRIFFFFCTPVKNSWWRVHKLFPFLWYFHLKFHILHHFLLHFNTRNRLSMKIFTVEENNISYTPPAGWKGGMFRDQETVPGMLREKQEVSKRILSLSSIDSNYIGGENA